MLIFNALQGDDILRRFFGITGIKLNILISYYYIPNKVLAFTRDARHMINRLYLDSGAYSAKYSGACISRQEYLRFVIRTGEYFDQYFNLDDDFMNPAHNLANQTYLEDHLPSGFKRPIPVIHDTKDTFGELEMYVEKFGHDYVALGSNSQRLKPAFFQKVDEKYPDLKIHFFGNLKRKMLFSQKPYSADSAAFQHQALHGSIYYWDPLDERDYTIYLGGRVPPKKGAKIIPFNKFHHQEELRAFLKETFGFTHKDLLGRHGENAARVANLYFFHQLEGVINS